MEGEEWRDPKSLFDPLTLQISPALESTSKFSEGGGNLEGSLGISDLFPGTGSATLST